jgi:hypothetical protein
MYTTPHGWRSSRYVWRRHFVLLFVFVGQCRTIAVQNKKVEDDKRRFIEVLYMISADPNASDSHAILLSISLAVASLTPTASEPQSSIA